VIPKIRRIAQTESTIEIVSRCNSPAKKIAAASTSDSQNNGLREENMESWSPTLRMLKPDIRIATAQQQNDRVRSGARIQLRKKNITRLWLRYHGLLIILNSTSRSFQYLERDE